MSKIKLQIQEINRLIKYDRSKTLMEQDTMFTRSMDRQYSTAKGAQKMNTDVKNNIHFILPFFGFITSWLPPVSLMFELADAAAYYAEGDKEMAGLAMAFAIIPGGEMIRMVPSVKNYGKNWLLRALQKSKLGSALSNWELKAVNEVIENGREIARVTQRRFLRLVLNRKFKSLSLLDKIGVTYKIFRTYKGSKLLSLGVQVGGVYYTYKKLGEIFGFLDSPPDVNKIDEITSEWSENNNEELSSAIEELLMGDLSDDERDAAMSEFFGLTDEDWSEIEKEISDERKKRPDQFTDNHVQNYLNKNNNNSSNNEIIVTDFDKVWDYKKVGNEYFTKRKTSNSWIKPTGKALESIKTKVFKD